MGQPFFLFSSQSDMSANDLCNEVFLHSININLYRDRQIVRQINRQIDKIHKEVTFLTKNNICLKLKIQTMSTMMQSQQWPTRPSTCTSSKSRYSPTLLNSLATYDLQPRNTVAAEATFSVIFFKHNAKRHLSWCCHSQPTRPRTISSETGCLESVPQNGNGIPGM